jgi:phosphatidylserine decarboxylase
VSGTSGEGPGVGRRARLRLAPGGRRRALALALAALPAALLAPPVGALIAALAATVAFFYRDPERSPAGPGLLAPADGRVSVVREEGDRLRVGTYMSPRDVHVVRAPARGYVETATRTSGGHWPAFSKESERNERVTLSYGAVEQTLVAGTLARRITPYVGPGTEVARGERVGHIAFGSRTDLLLPPSVDRADLAVEVGERVRAGETVLVER